MITINNTDGRLSAWGKYADVKWIYWRSIPKNLPRAGGTLDLTGKVIEAEFKDGTTANVTQYCTFSPAEGTSIPATAKSITVTAFYPARSGKTFEAPLTLPCIYPYVLQIVTAPDYKPKENWYNTSSPDYDSDTMPLVKDYYKTYALYASGEEHEIVYAEKVENPTFSYVGIGASYISGIKYDIVLATPNVVNDATVYHDINEPSVESFTHALEIKASATVEGAKLNAETYLETNPVEYFIFRNMPTTTGSHDIDRSSNFAFQFADGSIDLPIEGLTDRSLYFSLNAEPTVFNIFSSGSLTFTDGDSGSLYLTRDEALKSPRFPFTKYNYTCEDGSISWERQ